MIMRASPQGHAFCLILMGASCLPHQPKEEPMGQHPEHLHEPGEPLGVMNFKLTPGEPPKRLLCSLVNLDECGHLEVVSIGEPGLHKARADQ